ncbi:NADP-dependent oxidoreductase [Flavisphingomonas formosensis]|uniref:NADP-dependent oxidoreductase n=1 Tax=Flavisphingomonas formosensis TaxID=861534 RepID=UPI0012FC3A4C|nr:NADP-dependent oxidoreductase [Sphingomonas formosensis]
MKIMRAHAFGGPDILVLDEVEAPAPGAGQILVRTKAIGVNPVDWKLLSGTAPVLPPLPLVPGGDIAGIVDAVGAGVESVKAGDPVIAHPGLTGCYAEARVMDAAHAAPLPEGFSFAEGASLPLVGLTAWQGLRADGRDLAGLTVLIHNAAGGVGTVAVQMVKARGGRVVATASPANTDFVRALGADEVVDFRTAPVEGRSQDIDILLDLVGNSKETGLWSLVRSGGSVIRIAGGADAAAFEELKGVRAYKVRVRPSGAQLGEIAALASQGLIRAEIALQLPFARAAEALAASKGGHVRGKIVLTVD